MGRGDFRLQIVERLVEALNLVRQNLRGSPGGVRERRVLFKEFDKLAGPANPFGLR